MHGTHLKHKRDRATRVVGSWLWEFRWEHFACGSLLETQLTQVMSNSLLSLHSLTSSCMGVPTHILSGPAGARQRLPSLRPRASILPFFPLFARLPSPRSLIDATIPPPKSELEEERRRRGEFGRTGPRGGSGKSKHDGLKEENQCCPPPPSPLPPFRFPPVGHTASKQSSHILRSPPPISLPTRFPPPTIPPNMSAQEDENCSPPLSSLL